MNYSDITFKQKLLSVMKDNKYDRWVGGKRTGKLDTKRIFRIAQSDRVFKKKQERKGKHYSVSLLVDCSGSMAGSGRDRYAVEAADKLAKAFEAAGVDLEIVGFNVLDFQIKEFGEKYAGHELLEKRVYQTNGRENMYSDDSRKSNIVMTSHATQQLVTYAEWETMGKPSGWSSHKIYAGNADGKAIYEAVKRIKNRPGTQIVVVLSDGQPSIDFGTHWFCPDAPKKRYSDFNLKKEVDAAIREGIIFVGIGINSDAVEKYYPKENTLVIHDSSQLYTGMVNKLDKLIKRG